MGIIKKNTQVKNLTFTKWKVKAHSSKPMNKLSQSGMMLRKFKQLRKSNIRFLQIKKCQSLVSCLLDSEEIMDLQSPPESLQMPRRCHGKQREELRLPTSMALSLRVPPLMLDTNMMRRPRD